MVSFYFNSCCQTLKKKQTERHYGMCGGSMCCINCKKDFNSFNDIKAHVKCDENNGKQKINNGAKKVSFYEKNNLHNLNSVKLNDRETKIAGNIFF